MGTTAEYLSAAETAKLVRVELAREFPGTKFSVRSHSYSMGSSIYVKWTDGPSQRQVDKVVRKFGGKSFDGMDDSTHYHDTEHNGRLVHFSNWPPSCSRTITSFEGWKEKALEIISTRCRVEDGRFGNDWIDNLASNMAFACDFRESDPLERAFRLVILREDI